MTEPDRRLRQVRWTGPALEDLREIRAHVSRDDPPAARRLWQRICQRVEELPVFPLAGRAVPEFPGQAYREVIVAPYPVVCQARDDGVVVVRVWHGRRHLHEAIIDPEPRR